MVATGSYAKERRNSAIPRDRVRIGEDGKVAVVLEQHEAAVACDRCPLCAAAISVRIAPHWDG